jgi:hypothetical protein
MLNNVNDLRDLTPALPSLRGEPDVRAARALMEEETFAWVSCGALEPRFKAVSVLQTFGGFGGKFPGPPLVGLAPAQAVKLRAFSPKTFLPYIFPYPTICSIGRTETKRKRFLFAGNVTSLWTHRIETTPKVICLSMGRKNLVSQYEGRTADFFGPI